MTNIIETRGDAITVITENHRKTLRFNAITPSSHEIIAVSLEESTYPGSWRTMFIDLTLAELKEIVEWMENSPHDKD